MSSGGACFIVIAPKPWKDHDAGPFLAVPTVNSEEPLDISALLGDEGTIFTYTVMWNDGVGVEFHTLVDHCWNHATQLVMMQLGIDHQQEEQEQCVCTIVTQPGKLPLTRLVYEWFSKVCKKSLY